MSSVQNREGKEEGSRANEEGIVKDVGGGKGREEMNQ